MYLGKRHRDRELLSSRTHLFIRLHHLLVLGIAAWVGYLFAVKELF